MLNHVRLRYMQNKAFRVNDIYSNATERASTV